MAASVGTVGCPLMCSVKETSNCLALRLVSGDRPARRKCQKQSIAAMRLTSLSWSFVDQKSLIVAASKGSKVFFKDTEILNA